MKSLIALILIMGSVVSLSKEGEISTDFEEINQCLTNILVNIDYTFLLSNTVCVSSNEVDKEYGWFSAVPFTLEEPEVIRVKYHKVYGLRYSNWRPVRGTIQK